MPTRPTQMGTQRNVNETVNRVTIQTQSLGSVLHAQHTLYVCMYV